MLTYKETIAPPAGSQIWLKFYDGILQAKNNELGLKFDIQVFRDKDRAAFQNIQRKWVSKET